MKSKQYSTTKKTPELSKRSDHLLWVIIIFLLLAGTIANSYFYKIDWALRAAAAIPIAAILIALISRTTKGQQAWTFIKSARGELNKVVWPSRQETVQTTLVVVAMVVVTAIFLWGIDSLFLWLVSLLTGQRG